MRAAKLEQVLRHTRTGRTCYLASKLFCRKEWAFDETTEKARECRSLQQKYINRLLRDLKDRLASWDKTPCIQGNILRQGILNDEEALLVSYTGSLFAILFIHDDHFVQ